MACDMGCWYHLPIATPETANTVQMMSDPIESPLLQTGADTVVRIRGEEIAGRRTTTQSIMPLGMLNDFSADDLADLYAYLQTLAGRFKN